jgi:hypothetical protein
MIDFDGKHRLLNFIEAGLVEKFGQVTLAGTGKVALTSRLEAEAVGGVPQGCERTSPAGVIPDRGSYHSSTARNPTHL